MSTWLTIIGIGEDGYAGLGARAREALQQAAHVVGSERTLAMMPALSGVRHIWPQPFSAVVEQINALRGQPTVILATGDPMNFGVARKVLTFIAKSETEIIPHLSAFSLAAARLGWSLPDCDCFTIHGRPAGECRGLHPAGGAASHSDRGWLVRRRGLPPPDGARFRQERRDGA